MSQQGCDPPSGEFEIQVTPPDIRPWLKGNTGIPGVTTLDSSVPGPHVALVSLMHGNEYSGAVVLDRLLRAGVKPLRGRLSCVFANTAAFARFDRRHPVMSRFIEEDLNRVWDPEVLDGPRRSIELDRARELRPVVETADVVLDLHSMLWPSPPMILSGLPSRAQLAARQLATISLVVADSGHANGRRLIDYPRFSAPNAEPVACLVEAGLHWEHRTVDTAEATVAALLGGLGMAAPVPAPPPTELRLAVVTHVVTARTSRFSFAIPCQGGDIVAKEGTLIATDATAEIRTPYDNCLLVMPSMRPGRGHTAVRLARFADWPRA